MLMVMTAQSSQACPVLYSLAQQSIKSIKANMQNAGHAFHYVVSVAKVQ